MKTRCEECGWRSSPNAPQCPKHPNATMIPWPKRMTYAMGYVVHTATACNQPWQSIFLDTWVKNTSMWYFTGCRRIDLQEALRYARRWQLPEFREGQAKPVTPVGLYGGKP